MKSAQRDAGPGGWITFGSTVGLNLPTFGAAFPITMGHGQPGGIQWICRATATGVYVYNFDPRIIPVALVVSIGQNFVTGVADPPDPNSMLFGGTFTIYGYQAGNPANANHTWVCTARDTR